VTGTKPTRLPTSAPTHTHPPCHTMTLLRLPTMSSSSPLPEQPTPTSPWTTYQGHTQLATCKNHSGLCQTISRTVRGPNSSDFGHSLARERSTPYSNIARLARQKASLPPHRVGTLLLQLRSQRHAEQSTIKDMPRPCLSCHKNTHFLRHIVEVPF
jgi:hypothetical protein